MPHSDSQNEPCKNPSSAYFQAVNVIYFTSVKILDIFIKSKGAHLIVIANRHLCNTKTGNIPKELKV